MKLRLSTLLISVLLATSAYGLGTTTISKEHASCEEYDDGFYDTYKAYTFNYQDTHLSLSGNISLGNNSEAWIYWGSDDKDEPSRISGKGNISARSVFWELGSGTFIFSNTGKIAGGENNIFGGGHVILDTASQFDQIMMTDTLEIWNSKANIENISGISTVRSEHTLSTKNIGGLIGGAHMIETDVLINGTGPDYGGIFLTNEYSTTTTVHGHVTFQSKTQTTYHLDPPDNELYFNHKPDDQEIAQSLKPLESLTLLSCPSYSGSLSNLALELEYMVSKGNGEYDYDYNYYTVSGAKYGTFVALYNPDSCMFDIVFRSFASASEMNADEAYEIGGTLRYTPGSSNLHLKKNLTLASSHGEFLWDGNGESLAIIGKGSISAKKELSVNLQNGYFTLASGCSFKNGDYTLNQASLSTSGALAANSLNLSQDSSLSTAGGKVTVKGNIILQRGSSLDADSSITAAALSMTDGAMLNLDSEKAQKLTLNAKGEENLIAQSYLNLNGSMTVAGDLSLHSSWVTIWDGADTKPKPMGLSVKGKLTMQGHPETQEGTPLPSDEGDLYLTGKLSAGSLKMREADIVLENPTPQSISLTQAADSAKQPVENSMIQSSITANGSMSVAGNLMLTNSHIQLRDSSSKKKALGLTIKGSLTLGSGCTLTLSGALSARDMVLDGGTINLTSNKPLTIKVGNRLDINGPVDLNLGFTVADKDVNKKSFKILTFKSSNLGGEEELYDLLGLSDSYCSLSFDKKKTSVMLTVTDKEAWDAYIADEETEAPTATTALVNPALPDYSGVADALVQANWGLVESSRAFVNAIGNRSMAVQLGSGEHAVWASAIAGASRRSSSGTHGGADTNITGGAIGMETQLGENSLLGMALGNSWTRVSAHNYGTIKQDTTHLGVYGQTNWNKLSADWSAAYGRSESKFNGSDWSQRAIQLDGRLSYNHALSETVLLRGFGGVQYYASDSARVDGLDAGEVQNLRGEIGVGIVRSTQKSSVYAELALHQDIVRDNPEVRSPFGQRYHGTNPGRTGINLTIGGSYALSDQWSVNASYTAEVVENANAHSVNVGATYKF